MPLPLKSYHVPGLLEPCNSLLVSSDKLVQIVVEIGIQLQLVFIIMPNESALHHLDTSMRNTAVVGNHHLVLWSAENRVILKTGLCEIGKKTTSEIRINGQEGTVTILNEIVVIACVVEPLTHLLQL